MTKFVHLHNHSEYSLLDGLTTPEEMAELAEDAVAVTDHGNMGAFIRLQRACEEKQKKPIFGIEAYFVDDVNNDDKDEKAERFHLILLAKNDNGLRSLYRLNNEAWTEKYYYKPRIDFASLDAFGDDLICLSGCMGSALSQAILSEDFERAEKLLSRFRGIFGEDYYLEVQPHNPAELNAKLIEYSSAYDIPLVGTLDCHFPSQKEWGVEEVLLASGQSGSLNAAQKRHVKDHYEEACGVRDLIKKMDLLYPDRRLSFKDLPLYMMGGDEAIEHFTAAGVPTVAIDNTIEIAEKCSAKIKMNSMYLPSYAENIKVKMTSNEYLRDIAFFFLEQKGFGEKQEYIDRLNEELSVILEKNFSDYFLVLWDLCNWADQQGIPRGPARGSSAGSLLSFCLNITKVDPLEHGLLFFRFINPERNDFPDIDLDFGDKYRDMAKEYLRQRWGEEYVAGISAYGTFKAKAAIKDLARTFGVPFKDANDVSKLFETLEEYETGTAPALVAFRKKHPELLPVAKKFEGRYKNASAHAAGVVVSNVPLRDIVPIEVREERETKRKITVVAYDKDETGDFGLIKLDALGVRAITVIDDCIKAVEARTGINVEARSLDINECDDRVFQEFSAGNVVGIFQAEGAGYANLIAEMGINNFNDLAVSNALVRPGSYVTQGKKYLARRDGTERARYDHQILEDILGDTYGTMIFEEQVMKIAVELAGFTWGKADRLRKIISKKKDAKEFDAYKEDFVTGASEHISVTKAKSLWKDIEKASLYMFNKSHAVSYSQLSYQTMWLKINYPLEFMWATLANETVPTNITTYLFECQRLGIELLGPDVNRSEENFSIDGDGLRFGISNISGVGASACQEILAKRPFRSFEEFTERTAKNKVRSNNIEAMQKVGFFESLDVDFGYEKERYYGPLLNYPITTESKFDSIIVDCSLANEKKEEFDLYIVRGMVKSTKRTARYHRVEIEDSSGVCSSFADRDAQISKRDYVIALVGDQTLHHFDDFNDVETGMSDSKFAKFLRDQVDDVPNPWEFVYDLGIKRDIVPDAKSATLAFLINTVRFKTRNDNDMGSAYFYVPNVGWRKFTLFGSDLAKHRTELDSSLEWKLIKTKPGKRDVLLDNIINMEKWAKMKNVQIPEVF